MTMGDGSAMDPVEDVDIRANLRVSELVDQLSEAGGFTAPMVAAGVEILERMYKRKSTIFLSFPAAIISTGIRGVIRHLVEQRMVSVIITTCGTLDHDLARVWGDYEKGSFEADDVKLLEQKIHRLGNVFVPMETYGPALEAHIQPFLEKLYEDGVRTIAAHDLIWRMGEELADESSILYWAAKNRIPVIVPGITDGAVGSQLWLFSQAHPDFLVDVLADETVLSDIVFTAESTGGFIIGGGISKHHVIWWNQFRDGLDSAVYITTATEYDGSLSGARMREAVSWGKMKPKAEHITIPGEATVIVPIMIAALLDRLGDRNVEDD